MWAIVFLERVLTFRLTMKISRKGSSVKQYAYARRTFGGKAESKKQIALDVGYSPAVANSCVSKIESRPGFNNAMAELARESNNMALSVLHEFKARGLEDFSNKDLVAALNAIGSAWDRFNKGLRELENPGSTQKPGNRLRAIIIDRSNAQPVQDAEMVNVEEISPIQATATPVGVGAENDPGF